MYFYFVVVVIITIIIISPHGIAMPNGLHYTTVVFPFFLFFNA